MGMVLRILRLYTHGMDRPVTRLALYGLAYEGMDIMIIMHSIRVVAAS